MPRKFLIPFMLALLTMAPAANAAHYLSGTNAVDSGEIRWGGTTQYTWERDDGINTWNTQDPIFIAPDTIWTIEDVTYSDVNCGCYPWYGSYQYSGSFSDSIFFNVATMSTLDYNGRRHVATHELGHALGLAHSISGNVMYTGAFQYTLGTQDLDDYHYLWGY